MTKRKRTCCTLICCLELLVLAATWEDIERTKNMSVFMKDSEQLLSNLRNNLRKAKETLDRLALDSEQEELLSDNEAKQVEALGAQLSADFLRHNDKSIRDWNSEEGSSAVLSKTNKGTLQDILTLLLPSNLKGSDVSSDLGYDAQSNLFGFGNGFQPASNTFPTPSPTAYPYMPQDFLLRTIMRAPPPLPKYQGISRVRVNGSIVCFSVLHVCPTISMSRTRAPSATSTGREMINAFKYKSIKSVTERTQMSSSASSTQPGSLIPIDVYLKNRDVELDESSSSDYMGGFTESISTLQTGSDDLFQNTDRTESLEDSATDSKLDDIVNTVIINNDETGHDDKIYKLLFGGKENSTESTSSPILPSSTEIKQNNTLSTLFEKLALTTGSTINSTNNVTVDPTKSASDETEAFKMQNRSSTELVTTASVVKSNLGNGNSTTNPSSTASSNTSTSESTETTCAVISTWPGFVDGSTVTTESSSTEVTTSVSSTSKDTSSYTGATTASLPTSTTTATTPGSTRKMNFFLKMLYYLPNTRHKPSSTTPIPGNNGDSEPFQLVILDPQIFQFSKGNATPTTSTSKP